MTTTQTRMTIIFNEWAARYAAKPEDFEPILDAQGKAVEDYGRNATHYFEKIARELDAQNKLPRPDCA